MDFHHPYHLDESISILGISRVIFSVLFICRCNSSKQNSPGWDAASHRGLFCLPMTDKEDVRHAKGYNARLYFEATFSRPIMIKGSNEH